MNGPNSRGQLRSGPTLLPALLICTAVFVIVMDEVRSQLPASTDARELGAPLALDPLLAVLLLIPPVVFIVYLQRTRGDADE